MSMGADDDEEKKVAADMCCACCGVSEVDEIKLNECDDCDLVRYCSDECKDQHRSEHEQLCKRCRLIKRINNDVMLQQTDLPRL